MRMFSLVCVVLLASLAWSQQNSGGAAPAQQPPASRGDDDKETMPDSAAAVAPDAAVLTIQGFCPGAAPKPEGAEAACQTVVTRAQFERLATAIHANVPTQRRQLATSYPRLLAMAREAEQRGLDKQTHFQEMIAFSRLQILSQELVHSIQDEAAQVPAKDIEDYYRGNAASFERADLERVTVPNIRQVEPKKDEKGKPAEARSEEIDKEFMRREAEGLRTRALAGEDFTKLQKHAYNSAGLSTPAPPTSLLKARRSSLPAAQQAVFDLKPGEISAVIGDAGGYYIYKLNAKDMEPLSEAENEIHKKLEDQRMRAAMQKIQDSVTPALNQAYFGAAAQRRPSLKTTPGGMADGQAATPKQK
jgi:hypothetical protein